MKKGKLLNSWLFPVDYHLQTFYLSGVLLTAPRLLGFWSCTRNFQHFKHHPQNSSVSTIDCPSKTHSKFTHVKIPISSIFLIVPQLREIPRVPRFKSVLSKPRWAQWCYPVQRPLAPPTAHQASASRLVWTPESACEGRAENEGEHRGQRMDGYMGDNGILLGYNVHLSKLNGLVG